MLKQIQPGQPASLKQAVDPIAIPNPGAAPADRDALLARLSEKFDGQLREMHREAHQHNAIAVLADRVTLGLANEIVNYGTFAAGDVLKFLGQNILWVTQYRNAQAEAQAAKEQGERAH
jgi:hypothetical protein